jgi:hypothetical protein
MRRTLILGAVTATTLTIGLGVGATMAASDPLPPTSTSAVAMIDAMNGAHMTDADDMTSMMSGRGMATTMDADGMDAMHTAMHQAHHPGNQP